MLKKREKEALRGEGKAGLKYGGPSGKKSSLRKVSATL